MDLGVISRGKRGKFRARSRGSQMVGIWHDCTDILSNVLSSDYVPPSSVIQILFFKFHAIRKVAR